GPAWPRSGTGCEQRRVQIHSPVTIAAGDLDRRGDLAVDVAVSVCILPKVAVDAMHAAIEVDGRKVHCLLELPGIIVRDGDAILVEQRSFAVTFENRAEVPSVPMVVGELGVLEAGVEG